MENWMEPTPEMVAFFERRTNEHIDRVRKCLAVMASVTKYADELQQRACVHDASKFTPEERVPYIWLTEFHRCRRTGEPFAYPDGMEARVRAAIDHHTATNRHHPDFHADPNDMTDVDLIEMVCDWTAMSQGALRNRLSHRTSSHGSPSRDFSTRRVERRTAIR
jgi:hypothetical protein